MVRVITIENPFEPKIHELNELVYTGKTVAAYTRLEGRDVFINGRAATELSIPADGDYIISMPHVAGGSVGEILGFVALVALTVVTGGIAAHGLTGFLGLTIKGATLASCLAAGAVMYLGGRIINSVFPQTAATSYDSYNNQTSQTYGWNLPTVQTQEGGIIGETYGTCIPQPQLLEEHVETIDGKQYLNLLYCGGYGEIDSISDMRIDSTPIDCFTDVQAETRLGTNDQTPIEFFDSTPIDQSVGLLLDLDKPIIRTTDSTQASELEITLEWPNGLYHLNDSGNYEGASIVCRIDYRKTGDDEWLNHNSYTISNSSSDYFRKSFRWNVYEAAQYDIKVTLTQKPSGSRYMTYTYWSILTAYNSGIYSRPNKVLVALRILATNQLSGGVPNLTWKQTRSQVFVYNPYLLCYEKKAANNPIWAAYDILHGCRKLKNPNTGEYEYLVDGCAHEHLDAYYDEWVSAASYADEKILNNNGEYERRFEFDAFFDTAQKRYDAAVKAAAVGHANIIIHGCNYGITVDRPGTITQVFSEGRTTQGSVQGSFLSRDERARSVEITYNDENNDFKNTQFTLRSTAYVTDEQQDNTAQLTLFGVKRRTQAYREGVMALASSERQLQTIELSTDINGITAEYGDIVGFAHSVSKIGIASGRLLSATANTVRLDKQVTMIEGKVYEIYLQTSLDKLIHRLVVNNNATTDTITIMEPFDDDDSIAQYDCYTFGEAEKSVKPFRIVGAERDGDFMVKLRMIEYDEAVYSTELDYNLYPKISYASSDSYTVENVTATEDSVVGKDGTVLSYIDIAWERPEGYHANANGYSVLVTNVSKNSTKEFITTELSYRYSGAEAGETYRIQVRLIINGNRINGGTVYITVIGKDSPPENVSYMSLVQSGENITAVITPVSDTDLSYYELRMGSTWDNSSKVIDFTGNTVTFRAAGNGTYTYLVKAVDTSSNESEQACSQIIEISSLATDNILFEKTYGVDEFASSINMNKSGEVLQMIDTKQIKDFEYFREIFDGITFLDGTVYLPCIDLGANVSVSSLSSLYLTVTLEGDSSSDVQKEIRYRTSPDGITYSDWILSDHTAFKDRFIEMKVYLHSTTGHTQGFIKTVKASVDVPDTEITLENISLAAGDNYVSYGYRFVSVPKSILIIASDSEGKSVAWKVTDSNEEGIHITLSDDGGQECAGKIVKATIRGY